MDKITGLRVASTRCVKAHHMTEFPLGKREYLARINQVSHIGTAALKLSSLHGASGAHPETVAPASLPDRKVPRDDAFFLVQICLF